MSAYLNQALVDWLGVGAQPFRPRERVVSMLGGALAIAAVFLVASRYSAAPVGVLASMGASAVLLFAVPHGALSQPWPVIGGHLMSASIGILCARHVDATLPAAALAVGLAIGAMHVARCIHPPGGATALFTAASLDAPPSWWFLLDPVLINVMVVLAIAVVFNGLFGWRRYPVALSRREPPPAVVPSIRHESFVYALSEMDTFVDVSEHDLLRIYDLAVGRERESALETAALEVGSCYSNGRYGDDWWVREVLAIDGDRVAYRVVAGKGRRTAGETTRAAFCAAARYRVFRDEDNWRRVGDV